jgi:hypothetical protein
MKCTWKNHHSKYSQKQPVKQIIRNFFIILSDTSINFLYSHVFGKATFAFPTKWKRKIPVAFINDKKCWGEQNFTNFYWSYFNSFFPRILNIFPRQEGASDEGASLKGASHTIYSRRHLLSAFERRLQERLFIHFRRCLHALHFPLKQLFLL